MSEEINRESCLFYKAYFEAGNMFDNKEKKLEFLEAVFEYGTTQKLPEIKPDDKLSQMAWLFVKPLLDANIKNYRNGRKGGAPKGSKNNPNGRPKRELTETNPKLTQNKGNDNDNVNVNVNDNNIIIRNDNEYPSPCSFGGAGSDKYEPYKQKVFENGYLSAEESMRRWREEQQANE